MGRIIDRRRACGGKSKYTQLEYLVSTTGAQYIDTGIKSTNRFKIDLELAKATVNSSDSICGSYINSQGGMYLYYTASGQFGCIYGSRNIYISNASYNDLNKHHVILDLTSEGLKTFVDNNLVSTNSYSPIDNNSNYYIFRCNENNVNSSRTARIKLYYFKIYSNDALVRDLIPCRRNSDNALGMYDNVSGNFFTSVGTEDFIFGPDKGTENPVNINVKTHSIGGSDASLDVITGDGEPINILWNTVLDRAWTNGYIQVSYSYSRGWQIYAITSCLYDGQVYNSGEVIVTWNFRETKDINIVANYEEILQRNH